MPLVASLAPPKVATPGVSVLASNGPPGHCDPLVTDRATSRVASYDTVICVDRNVCVPAFARIDTLNVLPTVTLGTAIPTKLPISTSPTSGSRFAANAIAVFMPP